MSLFSGVPEDPAIDMVMEYYSAKALYSAVTSLIHVIQREDNEAQRDAAYWTIQVVIPWMTRRLYRLSLAYGKPLVWILKENANLVDLEWTEEEQDPLKPPVERYTAQGPSGAWTVHSLQLGRFSFSLGDHKDHNNVRGQSHNSLAPGASVDCSIFQWLSNTFLTMVVNAPAECLESDSNEAYNNALLPQSESNE